MTDNLASVKDEARQEAQALRARFHSQATPELLESVSYHVCEEVSALPPHPVVAGYWPIGSELDVRLVLHDLERMGCRLVLPAIEDQGKPLLFRAWSAGDDLVKGPMNTREPHADAPLLRPDVLLVPLLAFDAAGYRLGYGGGYYDRSIEALRASGSLTTIGIAYAHQLVREVPRESHDQRLDMVISEQGAMTQAP